MFWPECMHACNDFPFHKLVKLFYLVERIFRLVGIRKYAEIVKLALLSPTVAASAGRRNMWSMSSRKFSYIRIFLLDYFAERHPKLAFSAL